MVDARAQRCRYTIGGLDYSAQVDDFTGSDDHLSESGIVAFRGRLVLSEVAGGLPLDNWSSTAFADGTLLVIEVLTGTAWVRHPRGALRVVGSEYNEDERQLSLELACILGARSFKQVPDQFLGGVEPGQVVDVGTVVGRLLFAAGIENFEWNASAAYTFRDRPSLSGSALESASKMLASGGAFMWCDRDEVVQIDDVRLDLANPIRSCSGYAFASFQRAQVGSPPAEELLVSGSYRKVYEREETRTTISRSFEPAFLELSNGSVLPLGEKLVRKTTAVETTLESGSYCRVEEETDLAASSVYRGWKGYPKTGMVSDAETTETTRYFEAGPKARLTRIVETRTEHRAIALQAYLDYLEVAAPKKFESAAKTGRIPASKTTETLSYDNRDRLIKRVKETKALRATLVAELGDPGWARIKPGQLTELVAVAREITTYVEILPDEWQARVETWVAQAKTSGGRSGLLALIEASAAKAQLAIALANNLVRQSDRKDHSNSGQTNPPQGERFPAMVRSESLSDEVVVRFPSFVSDWRPRRETRQCPYLPDVGSSGVAPLESLSYYGKVWGGVQQSQWRSARIEMALEPWLIDQYRPYAQVEVFRAGHVYRLALNGTSWAADQEQSLVSTDAALLGEQIGAATTGGTVVSPGVLQPPYRLAGDGSRLPLLLRFAGSGPPTPAYGVGDIATELVCRAESEGAIAVNNQVDLTLLSESEAAIVSASSARLRIRVHSAVTSPIQWTISPVVFGPGRWMRQLTASEVSAFRPDDSTAAIIYTASSLVNVKFWVQQAAFQNLNNLTNDLWISSGGQDPEGSGNIQYVFRRGSQANLRRVGLSTLSSAIPTPPPIPPHSYLIGMDGSVIFSQPMTNSVTLLSLIQEPQYVLTSAFYRYVAATSIPGEAGTFRINDNSSNSGHAIARINLQNTFTHQNLINGRVWLELLGGSAGSFDLYATHGGHIARKTINLEII